MKLLIEHKSPLNTIDIDSRTTILHAIDSHNNDALRMLLEAGADPNPELPEGLFRSSPLVAATFGGLLGIMKLLLEHGARVNACNPEGRTALHTAAIMQGDECAQLLLDYGADLSCINSQGHTPTMTAIAHNNHAVLKVFIDQCQNNFLKDPQLLNTIAELADMETMSIIAASGLLETPNRDDFAVARAILQSRQDYNKSLEHRFHNLCRWLPYKN